MVKLWLFLAILAGDANAVWQDDLYGKPSAEYFHKVYPKLLTWVQDKYAEPNSFSRDAKRYLELCAKQTSGWYYPLKENPELRLSNFSVRFSFDVSSARKSVSIRCLIEQPSGELKDLRNQLIKRAGNVQLGEFFPIGLEFTLGNRDRWRVITSGFELLFAGAKFIEKRAFHPYKDGSPPTASRFPLPWLVQAWSPVINTHEKEGYRIELRAYMDGIAPPELRSDIETLHREFGLLADSIYHSPGKTTEIFFP